MDFQTRRAIDGLVNQLADLQERVDRAERAAGTSQLPNSSLTGGSIRVIDADGTHRGAIGTQPDGTFAVVATNGPPPPAPSVPTVAAAQLALTIVWDGLFAEGDDGDPETQPKDFDHVQVHLSTTSGFTPDADSLRGTLRKPGALVCTPLLASTTYYAVLVGVNTSGVAGDASVVVSGVPDEVVATDILDGIVTTLKLADDAVTQAKIAAAAVGTTEISDNAITTPKVVAGAIQTAQIDAGAVNAGKIAAGAVTTAKLDALAVTAANIAANAITAGKIAAGAVTAGTLEATMVVATELQSTGYVAGSAGWKIDGAGTAEFNDADFRGEVTVGTSGNSQVHIYSSGSTGRIDAITGDVSEAVPGRIEAGVLGSGTTRILETNFFGPRVSTWNIRQGLVFDSGSADGTTYRPQIRIGDVDNSGALLVYLSMDSTRVHSFTPIYAEGNGSDGSTIRFNGPQPTTTGSWIAYTGGTWSQLPLSIVCPPSESMRITIHAVMSNRATSAATIGIGVRVRDATTGTNLYTPSSGDSYDGASVVATGTVLTADQTDTWVGYAGPSLLAGRAGHNIEFLPYYRLSATAGTVSVQQNRTNITVECLVNRVLNGTL